MMRAMSSLTCPYMPQCPGCARIAEPYQAQIDHKLQNVHNLFAGASLSGLDAASICRITPSPVTAAYRNRARLAVRPEHAAIRGSRIQLGLYRAGTHDVVDIPGCPVQSDRINAAVDVLREAIDRSGVSIYDEHTQQGDLRYVTVRHGIRTDQVLVGIVATSQGFRGRDELVREVMSRCKSLVGVVLNINATAGNAIFGPTCLTLAGRPYLEEIVCDVRIRLGLLSFFQVNTAMAELAYGAIVQQLVDQFELEASRATLFDLYCGVGTIGLVTARRVGRVVGIESNAEAVQLARASAELNGLSNVTTCEGLVEDRLDAVLADFAGPHRHGPALVAVNPPRKGLAPAVVSQIATFAPTRIAYLSCAPHTLIRDLERFTARGYEVRHVELFDMFPHTDQVETLAILERQ